MTPVWVVAVRDYREDFTFYGLFHTAGSAQLFCDRVNSLIQGWTRANPESDTPAWAYVERVERNPSSLTAFHSAVEP